MSAWTIKSEHQSSLLVPYVFLTNLVFYHFSCCRNFQLAFPDAIYLVDAIEGGEAVMRACKPALESNYITKVIHDCKRDSEVGNDLIVIGKVFMGNA